MESKRTIAQNRKGRSPPGFRQHGVKLTLGGEPTYVPDDPVRARSGASPPWGPLKLNYAYALANALIKNSLPGAVRILSRPENQYPGEVNPRWIDPSPLEQRRLDR